MQICNCCCNTFVNISIFLCSFVKWQQTPWTVIGSWFFEFEGSVGVLWLNIQKWDNCRFSSKFSVKVILPVLFHLGGGMWIDCCLKLYRLDPNAFVQI